jgi:hypothetical protein
MEVHVPGKQGREEIGTAKKESREKHGVGKLSS